MKKDQLPVTWRSNKKAWMTRIIFQEWIAQLNSRMARANRKILLLVDNFSGHSVAGLELTHVRMEFLPPNTTSRLQPLDAGLCTYVQHFGLQFDISRIPPSGIIHAFKARYRRYLISRVIQLAEANRDIQGSELFNRITVLEAILWVQESWSTITPPIIANCWRATKLVSPSVPAEAPPIDKEALANVLLELQQQVDLLPIPDKLLAKEFCCVDDHLLVSDDDEIISAAMAESGVAEKNNEESEQDDSDDDGSVIPLSTAVSYVQELRKVAVSLDNLPQRYHDMLLAFQSELNSALKSSMRQTTINDFFKPKSA